MYDQEEGQNTFHVTDCLKNREATVICFNDARYENVMV